MPQQTPLGGSGPDAPVTPVRAPDISQLTPQERADRLYKRVMLLEQQGKADSVLFFAPMAIDAYRMLGALDAEQQADLDRIVKAAAGAREGGAK